MRSHALALFSQHSPFFGRIESYCLLYGYVLSTPFGYCMAMPCRSTDHIDVLTDISRHLRRMTDAPDCLHIWCAVGDLTQLVAHLHALPHITHLSFQRFGRGQKHHIITTHGIKTKITAATATRHGQ